jgi:hypothetical protein
MRDLRSRIASTPPKARRAGNAAAIGGGPAQFVLSLQPTAGNRAVCRWLARSPAKPLRTGIRAAKPLDRYVESALRFARDPDNLDRPAADYAKALLAAAEAEIKPSGAPEINFNWSRSGEARRAEFSADLWLVSIFPASLGIEPDARIGDLDEDQQAGIARTIYHETRHAEQVFRVARAVAAEGPRGDTDALVDQIRSVTGLDPDVAAAASRMPLDASKLGAAERVELHDWRNAVDLYSTADDLAVTWRGKLGEVVSDLNRLALNDQVTDPDPDAARARVEGAIRGWDHAGWPDTISETADRVILQTMTTADATLLADLQGIVARYADVHAAVETMRSEWPSGDDQAAKLALVRAVRDALSVLGRQLRQAYEHMPNEIDAAAAGAEVEARFHERAKKMTTIRKAAPAGSVP